PDCDGPSVTGKRVGVFGWDRSDARLALYLLTWAGSVVLLANGRSPRLDEEESDVLAKYDAGIKTERIVRLEQRNQLLETAVLEGSSPVPLDALFFHLGSPPATDIAHQLGCKRDGNGDLVIDRAHQTSVPGIFAAGDIVGPPYLAVTAAAKGVT